MTSNPYMILPPKMAQQFVNEAKLGQRGWKKVGNDVYETIRGNIKICLVGLNPPTGHQYKISEAEARKWRDENKGAS